MTRLVFLLLFCFYAGFLQAQNCSNTTTGLMPLIDLGPAFYQGFQGGLYGNGQNDLPPAHLAAGLSAAAAIQPLDPSGQPSAAGRIALLSIGMSNTSQEFSAWIPVSNADPARSGLVVPVNGAQGGQPAATIANPNANYWNVVAQRLAQAGVTAQQVQAVWFKQANAAPSGGFPAAALALRDDLRAICQILKTNYPNLQVCFLSSRIYAGYATTQLNPEPYAYESGFAVQWLMEEQMSGSPAMNADPAAGPVVAPWIAWGPYTWADGLAPRSDGLVWNCADFAPDGTHPAASGRQRVADALNQHFKTHPASVSWYLGTAPALPSASVVPYGQGCAGSIGVPEILSLGLPVLGNMNYRIGVDGVLPGAPCTLFVSSAPASLGMPGGCEILVDPSPSALHLPLPADASTFSANAIGRAFRQFAIPADPAWAGVTVYAQWAVADPAGPLAGQFALTRALHVRIGIP